MIMLMPILVMIIDQYHGDYDYVYHIMSISSRLRPHLPSPCKQADLNSHGHDHGNIDHDDDDGDGDGHSSVNILKTKTTLSKPL